MATVTEGTSQSGGDSPQPKSLASLTASNSIWNATAFVASLGVTFITTPLYLHRLGETSYGIFILVTSILAPLGLLDLGIGPATIKYVAESESTSGRSQTANYIRSTLLFNLLIGVGGAVLLAALARVLTQYVFKIHPQDREVAQIALYWVALRWLAIQIGNTFSGIPVALRRYRVYSIGTMVANISVNLAGLAVLYAGGDLAAITQAQAWTASLLVGMWVIISRQLLPGIRFWPRLHRASFVKTFRFGFWQMASSIGALLAHETERTLLGILTSTAAVGFYSVASSVSSAVFSLLYALGQVLFPTFSHLQGLGQRTQASRIFVLAIWSLGVLGAALYVPLFVFAKDILALWVGPSVAGYAYRILRVLAVAGLISSLFVVPTFYLMGIGNTRWLAWISFLQGAITVGVSLLLIPPLGLDGAAWSILASTLAHVIFVTMTWKTYLREYVGGRAFFSMLASLMVISLVIGLALNSAHDALHWTPKWATLIVAYGLSASMTMGLIVLMDGLLPGGKLRRQEAVAIIARAVSTLRALT